MDFFKGAFMNAAAGLKAQIESTPIIPNSLALWGLGQMGLAIKGPDGLLVIDPCLTDVVRERFGDFWVRGYPPPMQPGELTGVSCLMASHEHLDHFDPTTLGPAAAASPAARMVAPAWCADLLPEAGISPDRFLVPPALQPITLPGTSARLTAVPAAHYDLIHDEQKGHRWLGYIIEWNGVTVYHAGDTIIYKGYLEMMRGLPTPDVALIPTNGRDWYREVDIGAVGNLMPEEAAYLARELGWGMVILGHNDLYPNNAIPMANLAAAMERYAPRQRYKIMQPGERLYVLK